MPPTDLDLMTDLKQFIRDVADFPSPGIIFRDIAPLLRSHFGPTIDAMSGLLSAGEWERIDAVAGIESRGFMLGSALALRHGKGFVPIRKKGKLPPPVVSIPYQLEYGEGVLEMQQGSGRLLLIDDVLATGGTLAAAADLCLLAGYRVDALAVLIDLNLIKDFRWEDQSPRTVIRY
jgi:adenine phosphoribosyltransferase